MALPRQVEAELREIEELEKQIAAQNEPEVEAEADEPKEEVVEETEAEVTNEAKSEEPQPEEATPAEPPVAEVADDFKQKYNTLRGKYDAEVPRLHNQVKELTEQLDMFRKDMEDAKKAEAAKPKEKVSYVTDADREEFGEELIDVQRRVAREVAQEYDEKLEAQSKVIEALQKQLEDTGGQIGNMSFSQQLHQLVPDFDQIDNDERWVGWLNEYDPMVNGPRREMAQIAFNNGDAKAVAHYVNLFKESIKPKEQPVADTRQAELEKQVAPTRSSSPTTQTATNTTGKVYSNAEIERAWDKVRILNTQGKYGDAEKLEAELTSAYMEGRVR